MKDTVLNIIKYKRRDINPPFPLNLKWAKIPSKNGDLFLYSIKTHDLIGKIAKKFGRDVR